MHRRRFIKIGLSWLLGTLGGLQPVYARSINAADARPPGRYRIALIIDDIGYSLRRARLFLDLNFPLTYSILPHLPYTRRLDTEIHDRGHEIMLHQPMEPHNPRLDPGPGALYVGDGRERIRRVIHTNLASVSHAVGVNNHMGSRFTCHRAEVRTTLGCLQQSGLFFIDSRTSGRSVAYRTACQMVLNTCRRDFFLDNVRDESSTVLQLVKARRHAEKYGQAVAIGHPYPETAAAIGRFARALQGSDIELVYASRLAGC
jgi:polysaccharide deacetylase 2 family uncharacterized protein YibQ